MSVREATGCGVLDDGLAKLFAVVRAEFRVETYLPDPDDPVLGGGRCGVAGCGRLLRSRGLCKSHYARWLRAGRPDLESFTKSASPLEKRAVPWTGEVYNLSQLPPRLHLEVAYALQCRHDERAGKLAREAFGRVVKLALDGAAESLLDRSLDEWLGLMKRQGPRRLRGSRSFLRYAHAKIEDLLTGADASTEYARDVWDARRLSLRVRGGDHHMHFDGIEQPWLREVVKRWAKFRLATGHAFTTIRNDVAALTWFAKFLVGRQPDLSDASGITRAALEDYLLWLSSTTLIPHTRLKYLVSLRMFLEHCRRHGWLEELPVGATLYQEDFPRRAESLPRFIPEFVMSQLERPDNLDRLADSTRNLVVVLIETGLRSGDACSLPFDPIVNDSVGWPCLHYFNSKVRTEQMIPLSPPAVKAIRAQQENVRRRWTQASPWLFPKERANPDAALPLAVDTLRDRLSSWQKAIDLRDEAGRPVRVTAHQFRHTFGTRLINAGVPQHLVQQLLGHRSPQMTAVYAHIHDSTLRRAFDDYQQSRVNIVGEVLGYEPEAPTAGAEWVKHNLARVRDSLPNGYCGRPPQQDCPHPNACLTCPDFQTTPKFLLVHRQQRDNTRILIATAEANGQFRLAANHRKVAASLDRIIPALEALEGGQEAGGAC